MTIARKNKLYAFTLIEMLVVVAIISILAALLMPTLQKTLKLAQQVTCASKMKQIGIAHQLYISDNKNWLSPCRDKSNVLWISKLGIYAESIFTERKIKELYTGAEKYACPICPSYQWGSSSSSQYDYSTEMAYSRYGGYGQNGYTGYGTNFEPTTFNKIKLPSRTILSGDANDYPLLSALHVAWWYRARFDHPGGMNVLYCDFHVGSIPGKSPYSVSPTAMIWKPDGSN